MRKFKRLFAKVKDPRARNIRHNLLEVLFIALAATICGAQSCTEMEEFGRSKEALLRQFLDLPHGIPSHDTFSNVLRALDPVAFEVAFRKFAKAFARNFARRSYAIDGKALRGAFQRGQRATPLHIVNVWAVEARMAVAQRQAPNRNETAGALEVLQLLGLRGAVVTADALHCTVAMAALVRERGGEYILALKKNRAKLYKAASALLARARDVSRAVQRSRRAHDRIEARRATVVPAPGFAEKFGFSGLKAIGRISSKRRCIGGKKSKPYVRYFALSQKISASRLLKHVRQHWGVENNLHHTLDVVFAEDRCRCRMGNGPANYSLLRKLALNMLQASSSGVSMRRKMQRAGWNDACFFELFRHMR